MPNPIKYSTGSESDALKKGNLFIGTGAVGKGPSDTTGYYQGPSVPTNGYVIYMNKVGAPGGLSYHSAANDSELISFTNSLAEESFTTVTQCFNYYYGQTDKVLVNQDYPADYPYIVMDGLVFYVDAGITPSYPGSGTTWSDINGLGPKNNGTLINGPTFNSANGGSIVFDGVDDQLQLSDEIQLDESWTLNYWQQLNITQNMFSIPSLFTVIPQAGTSAPGVFGVGFNIFASIVTIHIDSSDNIYVGGQYGGYDNIVRDTLVKINEDGSPNSQFNSGRAISNGGVVTCNKIQQLSNGNLVTAGTNWGPAGTRFFNSVSGTTIPALFSGNFQICTSFILDEPNNSMWVLDSWSTTYESQNVNGKIFKINLTDFSIDTTFDSSTGFKSTVGKTTVSDMEGVNDGIVLQDGNLLCIGTFMEYKGVPTSRIVKINSTTAALDTSFVYGTGFNNQTYGAIQMNNGTIVVVGQFTNYNGSSVNRIVGLTTGGTIDSNFVIGTGFNNRVNSVIYDSVNDKLFCFGLFTTYNNTTANRIVKLNSDGSINTSFDYGTGFNTTTNTGALDTQGRLVVLSEPTTTYQGQTIPRRICRINTNGTLDTTFNSGGFNINRFRQDTNPRLVNNTSQFIVGGFYGINNSREIINLPNGAMTFNGFKLYTIAFNHNTNQVLGYIDGVLKKTTDLTARLPFRGKTFRSYENFFNFNIYSRQLTDQEVLQNYNATKGRFGL